jgi:hypothetical protein
LFLGTIKVRYSADAIFVLSLGFDSSDVPIEVAKLGFNGDILWRATLEQSVQKRPTGGSRSCRAPGVALLDDGDPLIACAIRDQVILFRIGSVAGEVKRTSFLLPFCHHELAAALFLAQASPSSVWIFGSRPGSVYDGSCSWLGVISPLN